MPASHVTIAPDRASRPRLSPFDQALPELSPLRQLPAIIPLKDRNDVLLGEYSISPRVRIDGFMPPSRSVLRRNGVTISNAGRAAGTPNVASVRSSHGLSRQRRENRPPPNGLDSARSRRRPVDEGLYRKPHYDRSRQLQRKNCSK
jgi:hypothetical protein